MARSWPWGSQIAVKTKKKKSWLGSVFISKAYDCLPHDLMVAKVET